MQNRLSRLRAFFQSLAVDGFLVTDATNIRYLTGFPSADSWLLVTAKKAFYITDFRYVEEAKAGLKGVEVVACTVSLLVTFTELAKGQHIRVLGFDERHLTMDLFGKLKKVAGKVFSLKAANEAVEVLRVCKDAQEIVQIHKAIKINLEGYRFIQKFIKPGVTEQAILYKLEDFIRSRGVGFAFPPIIASGPNSAFPHAKVTERKVRRNEPLLIDFGIDLNGQKSDLTRMFFLGKMPRSFEKNLSLIKLAQEEAYKCIRPGVKARDVDAAARNFLAGHGLAKNFGHSLGHGVGLDVHEMPRISQKSGAILEENMVITIEPGVYFPKKYGVRLEEMVLVTKTGCEVLSVNCDQ